MAKGAPIGDYEKSVISSVREHLKDAQKRFKVEDVRREAAKVLRRGLAYSTVQRELSKLRDAESPFPVDRIWSLGAVASFPIPFAKVPMLLALQEGYAQGKMTIRHALWIVRLFDLFYLTQKADAKWKARRLRWLCIIAMLYAAYERSCDSVPVPCDTTHFDATDFETLRDRVLAWYDGRLPADVLQAIKSELNEDGEPDGTR